MGFEDELDDLLSTTETVLKEDLRQLQRLTDDRRRKLYNQIKADEETFKYEFEPEWRSRLESVDDQTFRGKFATAQLFLHAASRLDDRAETIAPDRFTEDEFQAVIEFDEYRAFDVSDEEELTRRIRERDDEIYAFVVEEVTTQTDERQGILRSQSNDIGKAVMAYLKDRYEDRLDTAERAVALYIQAHGLPNVIESIEEAVEATTDASATRAEVRAEVEAALEEFSERMHASLAGQERALRAEIDGLAAELAESEPGDDDVATELRSLRERVAEFESTQRQAASEYAEMADRLETKAAALDDQIADLERLQERTARDAAAEAAEAATEQADQLVSEELERLRDQRDELTAEVDRLERERERVEAAGERLDREYDDLENRVDEIETSVAPDMDVEEGPAVPASVARLYELDYVGRVETSLADADSITLPDGTEFTISAGYWDSPGSVQTGDRRDQMRDLLDGADPDLGYYPLGRYVRATVARSGLLSADRLLVIEAVVHANLEAYAANGFDAAPAGIDDLLGYVNHALSRAGSHDTPHLIAVASATGWTDRAVELVTDQSFSRTRFSREASLCLIDLETDELHYDQTDDLIAANAHLVERQVDTERVAACVETIRREYIDVTTDRVMLADVVDEHNIRAPVVKRAFEELATADDGRVLPTDAGLALDLTAGRPGV